MYTFPTDYKQLQEILVRVTAILGPYTSVTAPTSVGRWVLFWCRLKAEGIVGPTFSVDIHLEITTEKFFSNNTHLT